ncbi:polysaccharide biosynthesis protein [Chthoniobacter flavus Ellin428]|uniref:Polysaccharide biosynthesis protein n=1 Tax=Chthoniobacter flavus Ellin428 TaxID=497964 RepID=B4D8N6_9BACT|nr:flippase [Chthoniobacter flavus]EDY17258.1 polysaccharide biosynthesis protein [Chthoniobacter flavus Ellin428]TCO86919.1 O-antigen/teichoic acid export membrane protein [Chthoniobacter flavus]
MNASIRSLAATWKTRVNRFVETHPNVKAIVSNVGWLSLDTIVRMLTGLFLGTWVARYLQPGYFGEINYALAIAALVGAPAGLGITDILIRDLVKRPQDAANLLGTAFFSRMAAALVSYAILAVYSLTLPNSLTRQLLLISALTLCTQALTVAGLRFKADLRSKQLVIAGNIGFAVSALVRIFLVLLRRPVVEFAWVAVIETGVAAVMTVIIYAQCYSDLPKWRFEPATASRLLGESWPLILSAVAVTTYMRIDQVMLAQMLGTKQVGLYTAATKLSEITYIVPSILSSVLLPSIVRSKALGPERYMARLQNYYDMSAGLAYLLIVPLSLGSSFIIHFLYGKVYESSSAVLTVQVWALLFVFLGAARDQFLIAEGFLKFSFFSTFLGAVLNIGINLFLIPRYGPLGAASATVIAFAITVVVCPYFYSSTRQMSLQLCRAIFFPFRIWMRLRPKRSLPV